MNRKKSTMICCLILVAALGACKKAASNQNEEVSKDLTGDITKKSVNAVAAIVHPGMLHTAADFSRMTAKVNANQQPWLSGWNKLLANPHSSSSYAMKGPVVTIVDGAAANGAAMNFMKACEDAAAAYQNALRWKIKGDVACGNKAIQIMNAWSAVCTGIDGDSNRALAAGMQGYQWANAAEIMRGYSGWAAVDFTRFKNFMLNVYYPISNAFLTTHWNTCDTHYWSNWDLSNMCTVLAIGILCDDSAKINQAITYYRNNGVGNGYIGRVVTTVHPGGLGQGQEAGRDQGHATMVVPLLSQFCLMANNQGQDMLNYNPWNETNPRPLSVSEYIAKYNLNNTVPYTTYNNCDNVNQTQISSISRGTVRPGWELIYNYYVVFKGKSAPYSQQFAAQVRPEGGGGDYGPNSGSYDQLGFGTLTYTR